MSEMGKSRDEYNAAIDPTPHRGKDSRHRQSLLRVKCERCGRWFCMTHDGGRPRRHKCVPPTAMGDSLGFPGVEHPGQL